MAKYKLELNEEQAATLIKALDLYSRIGIGQFHEILDWQFNWEKRNAQDYQDIRDQLDFIKFMLTGMPKNASRGIFQEETPERCKIAWDIQQVVRHCKSWHENPEGGITVHFGKPMRSSQEPLPVCKVLEEQDGIS